ncbi:hypothetical protein ACFLZI_00485 [Nitrospirota bacterium]
MPDWELSTSGPEKVSPVLEEGLFPLPDISGWEYIGEKEKEYCKVTPGEETLVTYRMGNVYIMMVYFRFEENPFMYWYHDIRKHKTYSWRLDADNDRNFEYHFIDAEKGGAFTFPSGCSGWGY